MAASSKVGHLAVLVVGILASIFVSTELRTHAVDLIRHLRSGNWEVMTDRSTVEQIVRTKYADSSTWAINFAAATGQSFPLNNAGRRETVRLLGQQAMADSPNLRFNSAPLQVTYGGFLAQTLLELALPSKGEGVDPLRQMADELIRPVNGPQIPIDPTLYAKAQETLSKLPKTSLLKKALSDYDEFGRGRSLDFPAFEVASVPSDDAPGAWDAGAQTLPQLGKCKAKVSSLADPKQQVDANVALLPRLLEVSLDRRWLSGALLDEVLEKKGPLTSKYFKLEGDLRLVPERFWVLLPEDAWIEPGKDSDRAQVASWGKDNTCCRVVCSDGTFDLAPTSFRENKDATYTVRRSDQTPLLYAIVSRRRAGH